MNFKNLAILTALILFSGNSYAQKAFYLRPDIGGGLGNLLVKAGASRYDVTSSIPVKQGGVNIGYSTGRWRFEVGLTYVESGYRIKDVQFDYYYYTYHWGGSGLHKDATGTFNYRFRHILLPVNVGYTLNRDKQLQIVPVLGLGISYNTGAKYWYITPQEKLPKVNDNYSQYYRTISPWISAHILLDYKVSSRLSINLDPQFNLMLLSLEKTGNLNEQHYTTTATVGICWWLNHRQKAAETNPPVKM